jgi:two-component system phosphate regulon sensor histidine kinase PhoR
LLTILGEEEAGKREVASLASTLGSGRLRIDRATFDFFSASAPPPPPPNSALALAEAVHESWPLAQQQASGRAASTGEGRAFAAVWRRTPAGTAVLVGGIDSLMASTDGVMQSLEIRLALEDLSGRRIWGVLPADGERLSRTFRETGLPWTLQVATRDPAGAREVSARRRSLLAAGFGLMVLVIATASYFVFRAVNRELRVARLQSDFVAAVSHEFRTPLTALRHLTEILEEGDAAADRLPHYYGALGRETRRLHAMVESLLDFGRMEAGRRTYQLEDTSAAELARQVVDEYRGQAPFPAERVALQVPPSHSDEQQRTRRIKADREAIGLALRNLLDNALKYSAESSTVSVSVESRGDFAGISVEDHGAGIPLQEQRDVFRKFVRGTAARTLNVKGTGIGLAMADQIVKAHGGRLELFSEPGRGSRFTVWLPVVLDHP